MAKDLTTSRLDRQNILNNDLAVEEIQESVEIKSVPWNERLYLTKELVAAFFNVDIRTIERYISNFSDELKAVPSRFMRKIVCRLRLSEVNRQ